MWLPVLGNFWRAWASEILNLKGNRTMKKRLTEEQTAKAEAKRGHFRELCKQLAGMTDGERAEMTARIGAVVTCEGRELSLRNTLLLMIQCPQVSVVGGFRQWLAAGRCVRKGETARMIWIPTGRRDAASGEGEVSLSELAAVAEGDGGRARFITGNVFDISQTVELEAGEGAALKEDA